MLSDRIEASSGLSVVIAALLDQSSMLPSTAIHVMPEGKAGYWSSGSFSSHAANRSVRIVFAAYWGVLLLADRDSP